MNKKLVLSLITITFSIFCTTSQNIKNQKLIDDALKTETLENQFKILVNKSNDFQQFKNIKHPNLNKFTKNFTDSIKANKEKFKSAFAKINEQKNEIAKLKTTIESSNANIDLLNSEKDNINLFGISMSKTAYNSLLWAIIIGLLSTTLFLLFKFKNSNAITKQARSNFKELEEEFETHRKKALEREQVIRRKLQDEINKQRNV